MADMMNAATLPEAPVSWNARYRSPQGFDCQLTLRGTDPAEVLKVGGDLMTRMAAAGCTPTNGHGGGNGNGGKPKVCAQHNAEMRRHEKNGQVWYSHKTADGQWCRGGGQ